MVNLTMFSYPIPPATLYILVRKNVVLWKLAIIVFLTYFVFKSTFKVNITHMSCLHKISTWDKNQKQNIISQLKVKRKAS